jgi:phosphohistidine phosphatase
MEIYLIRHGIAAAHQDYTQDEARSLTNQGRAKTTQVAKRLAAIGLNFDLLYSSPLVRAQQTAQILLQQGLSRELQTLLPLAPAGSFPEALATLNTLNLTATTKIALVGHQPDLGQWAQAWVWGDVADKVILKKAGIIGLTCREIPLTSAQGEIFLLTSPRYFLQ